MINLKDIQSRYAINPEPREVTETRQFIRDSFKDLMFVEGTHQYFVGSKELPSVSAVCHSFQPEVDWDSIAARKAQKEGKTKEELLEEWHQKNITSTSCGSKTHYFGEQLMNLFIGEQVNLPFQYTPDNYIIPYAPKEKAVEAYWTDILNNPSVYPVMPETKIYIDNGKIKSYAGTFDILLALRVKNSIAYSIHDFKGLPLDTPILTTSGFKTMGTICPGDVVYDKDGNQATVLNCSSIHYNPCMKIKFDDGYSIVADHEHRWLISFLKSNRKDEKGLKKEVVDEVVMTTQELFDHMKKLNKSKKKDSRKIPKIFVNKSLNNQKTDLPIDPYVLGVWLGDGNSYSGHVTNMYDELFDEIKRRGYLLGEDVSQGSSGKAKTRCVLGLVTALKKLNLIKNKHIPDLYIIGASFEQRLDLLRGIMDTDGYYNKTRNRYVLETTRKTQAEFCVKILTSLGIKPTTIKTYTTLNGKRYDAWSVCFTTKIYPFLVRKIKVKGPGNIRYKFRNIVSVEYVDTVPTRCIEVNSPSHTYLAGKELIVTHNTNADLKNDFNRFKKNHLLDPFTDLIDEPLSIYSIQLSLYQLALESIGISVIDRTLVWLKEDGSYEKIRTKDLTNRLLACLPYS